MVSSVLCVFFNNKKCIKLPYHKTVIHTYVFIYTQSKQKGNKRWKIMACFFFFSPAGCWIRKTQVLETNVVCHSSGRHDTFLQYVLHVSKFTSKELDKNLIVIVIVISFSLHNTKSWYISALFTAQLLCDTFTMRIAFKERQYITDTH